MADEQPRPRTWEDNPPSGAQPAPGLTYLTGEEFLRSSVMANVANVTVRVTGRVLTPDNQIHRYDFTLTPGAGRTLTSDVRGLSSGWLLDMTMRASAGAPTFGAVWGMLELGVNGGANFVPMQTLRQGFFTTNTPLSLASAVSMLPLDGPGNLRSITGTTPGAGVNVNETVPAGARWELIGFRCQLVTSGVVGTRISSLTIDDGVNLPFLCAGGNSTQAASGTDVYFYGQGQPNNAGAANAVSAGLAVNNRLAAASRIRTQTAALDAADQYSTVQYLVREWMTGE